MQNGNLKPVPTGHDSPFEQIRRTNSAGAEFWSSREFAGVPGYSDYRNFEQVIQKAQLACFNSGQRIEDHFVDVTEMIVSFLPPVAFTDVHWRFHSPDENRIAEGGQK